MDLYNEIILDHYHNPHHAAALHTFTQTTTVHNPLCGDVLKLDINVQNGIIANIGFTGNGCAISQAAMSLLADAIIGKKISAVKKINQAKIYALLGIPISPGRSKCALLGLSALKQNLTAYEK